MERREIILISVPYTGTNFTAKLFTDRGYSRIGMNEPADGDCIRVAHCIKNTQIDPALKHVGAGCHLVLPCRHPFRCEESYRRRGDDVSVMIEAFDTLIEQFSPLTPYLMCVDSESRYDQLEKLKELDPRIKTDWEVVASKSGTADMTEFSPSDAVRDLVSRHSLFFGQFYELV